ncbi:hypothetical protein PBI_SPORTO_33 [Arthrobacter phage Sporto]|nr:hypothetical protein PBI_SPORTO_33 [Arthrobacter phage Sporto]
MKKTINKIKTFAQKHEEELTRQLYYVAGVAVGIYCANLYNKESFKHFAKRHPDYDDVFKDKDGNFFGFVQTKEPESN